MRGLRSRVFVFVAGVAGALGGACGEEDTSCTVETVSGGTRISCPDGTAATIPPPTVGTDTHCSVVENIDGSVTITCPGSSATTEPRSFEVLGMWICPYAAPLYTRYAGTSFEKDVNVWGLFVYDLTTAYLATCSIGWSYTSTGEQISLEGTEIAPGDVDHVSCSGPDAWLNFYPATETYAYRESLSGTIHATGSCTWYDL